MCIQKCAVVDDFNAPCGIKVHMGMCKMTRSGAERAQLWQHLRDRRRCILPAFKFYSGVLTLLIAIVTNLF